MKLAVPVIASIFILGCSVAVKGQAVVSYSVEQYVWERAVETGKGCFEYQNCGDDKWAFAIKPLVASDKLHLIGQRFVWNSADGVSWKREPKTDWGERFGMTYAHFGGKFWMTGGMRSWDKFHNDVWSSADGKAWTRVTSDAPWAARRNHSVVVFNEKLWIIGGAESSGSVSQTPTRFYNDVWNSDDGVRWTRVTASSPWSGRDDQHVLVFDNRLWLIGGTDHRDVWSSTNGKNWKLVTQAAPWTGRRGAGVVTFGNKIWVFGGVEQNDVWSSANGKDWQKVFEPAPWSTRGADNSVVFRDAIWIYAGKTGRPDSWVESGDVWKMRIVRGTSYWVKPQPIDSIPSVLWVLFRLFGE